MTTQIINNFNSLNSEDLSTVKGEHVVFGELQLP